MDITDKLRPFYLLQILQNHTDEDHALSTVQLCRLLKDNYGIDTFRTTIKSDIEVLQKAGYSIQVIRSTQNRYNLIERDFEVPEVKLLIDAVMSSRFITRSKSESLAAKLAELTGPFKAGELKRNLIVTDRFKPENEHVYLIADAINDAINTQKKIRFQMAEYNVNKERVLHNNGEYYVFSPYSLVWDGDYYYVVGFSDKYKSIGSHRVDRIFKRPEILNIPTVSAPADFDINEYVNTMFHMNIADREEVELLVENDLMDSIIDRFGSDVSISVCDQNTVKITTEVSVGPAFFNWIFGFQGRVRITKPESVKCEYIALVRKAVESMN